MSPDLLKVRACVNRHRGRDYAESVRARASRERRKRLVEAVKAALAAIAVVIVFFAAVDLANGMLDDRENVREARVE